MTWREPNEKTPARQAEQGTNANPRRSYQFQGPAWILLYGFPVKLGAHLGTDGGALLEEEGHRGLVLLAAVPDVAGPLHVHGPECGAALAAHDQPVDAFQVEAIHRPEGRLIGYEPHRSRDRGQVGGAV